MAGQESRVIGLVSTRKIVGAVAAAFLLIVSWTMITNCWENVDADEIVVIQSPFSGDLDWYTDAGVKWQGFGKITRYKKRSIYSFDTVRMEGGKPVIDSATKLPVGGIDIRFNDGGHGSIFGSVQYDMPLDTKHLTLLHTRFGSQDAVQKQLVETVTGKSIYLVGPLMSSRESYAEKRNDLIHHISDQIQNGVYRTRQTSVMVKDPITEKDKWVVAAEIVMAKDGAAERQEEAVLNEFGIKAFNFTIKQMPYDDKVEEQIRQQQQITMQVQTSIAEAKQAEQRAITVEAQGRADAAKAKWEKETIKAGAVVHAQQEKEVAETQAAQRRAVAVLDKEAAEFTKQQLIRLGEGEGERKRLVLAADGALEQKLKVYESVAGLYAKAIDEYKGKWVPGIVMAGPGGQPGASAGNVSGAQTMIDLLTAKAARDLNLDMSISAGTLKLP